MGLLRRTRWEGTQSQNDSDGGTGGRGKHLGAINNAFIGGSRLSEPIVGERLAARIFVASSHARAPHPMLCASRLGRTVTVRSVRAALALPVAAQRSSVCLARRPRWVRRQGWGVHSHNAHFGPGQAGGGYTSPTVTAIIGSNCVVFGMWQVVDQRPMVANFTCSWAHLRAGRWHTLFTSLFSQATLSHLAVNMLTLWSFAAAVPASVLGVVYLTGGLVGNAAQLLADRAKSDKRMFGRPTGVM